MSYCCTNASCGKHFPSSYPIYIFRIGSLQQELLVLKMWVGWQYAMLHITCGDRLRNAIGWPLARKIIPSFMQSTYLHTHIKHWASMLALISMINMLVFRLLEALESIERLKPRLLPHIFNWEILLPRALPMEHVVNTPVYLTLAPLIVCDKGFIAFSQINLRYSKRHLGRLQHLQNNMLV